MAAEAYPDALRACLEFTDWSFAGRFETLPAATLPIANAADPDLPYFFNLPDGLVRVQELRDGLGDVRWRRDGEGIRSDTNGPLQIRYTRMVDAETALPANFKTAVAADLATRLGPRFGLTVSKLDRLEQLRARRLADASAQDAGQASSERYDDQPDYGDWATEATR